MLRLAEGVILNLIISTYPFLLIILLRVTPTANRNSFRVALSFIIIPRVEALRTSTLGYEIATPTELLLLAEVPSRSPSTTIPKGQVFIHTVFE